MEIKNTSSNNIWVVENMLKDNIFKIVKIQILCKTIYVIIQQYFKAVL